MYSFFAWRNRWQGENDAVVTWLTQAAKGFMGAKPDTGIYVLAGATRYVWAHPAGAVVQQLHNANQSTSSIRLQQGITVGVDVSGKSGCDVLLATTYPADGKKISLSAGTIYIKAMSAGNNHKMKYKVDGNRLKMGGRTLIFDGTNFLFED
jgi:hypothetical protein